MAEKRTNPEQFSKEFADYVNTHIVGTETTHIAECRISGFRMNKGHTITVYLDVPGLKGTDCLSGPCFYAEELLEAYPGRSVAGIAEAINAQIDAQYDMLATAILVQVKCVDRGLDDYLRDDLIITAFPTAGIEDPSAIDGFITREYPEFGLTAHIKGRVGDTQDGEMSHFAPILIANGRDATDEDWEWAKCNSLNHTSIAVKLMPCLMDEDPFSPESSAKAIAKGKAVGGAMIETNQNYDWFYLLSPEVWAPLARDNDAEYIYIVPHSPYGAMFMIDSIHVNESDLNRHFRLAQLKAALDGEQNEPGAAYKDLGGIFVLDVKANEIRRISEDEAIRRFSI